MSINPVLGNRSAEHFFLLLLHADRDPTFQLNCLKALNSKTAQWPESFPQLLEKRLQLVNPAVFAEKKEPTRSATPEPTQPGEPIKGETGDHQMGTAKVRAGPFGFRLGISTRTRTDMNKSDLSVRMTR